MKCPYCGFDSKEQHCEKCRAWIPEEKPKDKPKDERKNKEMKDNGT